MTTAQLLPVPSKDEVRWRIAPGWEHELIGPEGLRLKEWLSLGFARPVKSGPHRTVYRVELPAQNGRPARAFYLKHDRADGWRSGGRNLLRDNPSRREWQSADELARREIPTVTPLALGERFRWGVVIESYLVTLAIPAARSLLEWTQIVGWAPPTTCTEPTLAACSTPPFPLESREEDRTVVASTESPSTAMVGGAHPTPEAKALRRRLVRATARLCAAMHQTGADHRDLHAENLVVQASIDVHAGGTPARQEEVIPPVHLIDVPGVTFRQPLDWPASAASLAMLAVGMMDHTTPGERWRFLAEYLRCRPELGIAGREATRQAAADLFVRVRATAWKVARSRDRRTLSENKDFQRLSNRRGTAHAIRGISRDGLARLLADPNAPLVEGIDAPLKLSHSSVVVRSTLEVAGQQVEIAYKRSRAKNLAKLLGGWLRPDRALRGWCMGHSLAIRGIATPRPLAVVRRGGLRPETWLATEWIAGGLDLHSHLWKLEMLPAEDRDGQTARAAVAIGRLLGRMHAWNVSHRDLKANNILVVERDGAIEPWLVDLDGVRILRHLSFDRRARDLARLAASLRRYTWFPSTALRRFLRAYLRTLGHGQHEWRSLWRATARHAVQFRSAW